MWGMSPIDQMICRIQYRLADYRGEFTPPRADRHTVEYPGYNGGSDWGGVSIDPVRGVMIANYNDMPNYLRLVPRAQANKLGIKPRFATGGASANSHSIDPQWGVPYAINVDAGWRLKFTKLMCKRRLRRHPRDRHRDRQDLVGSPARDGAAQWPVQPPDLAALRHRHAQQRRPGDDRERPDLHRRGDRTTSSGRSTSGPARRCGRRPSPPAVRRRRSLPAGRPRISGDLSPAAITSWKPRWATA
jgi:Glucose dehydrogenase